MAAITSIETNKIGDFDGLPVTLTADDTITFDASRVQLLVLANTTASPITATIDGEDGTTVAVQGLGNVSVAAGLGITVPANTGVKAIRLGTVSAYCQGVVHIKGGTGLKAQLFNI